MKEYTMLAALSVAAVVALDMVVLKTRLLATRTFWIFMLVMYLCMTVVNGYLTWRPIVLYGEQFNLGVRVMTIPVEDYLYGFSLTALSVIVWERLMKKKGGNAL